MQLSIATDSESTDIWGGELYLPPALYSDDGEVKAPYELTIAQVAELLGASAARRTLLHGLLRFRGELADAGISTGFQWINGSFTENVEASRGRPPRDIDVVTFFELPRSESQESFAKAHPHLFNQTRVMSEFHVDSYFQPLGEPTDARTVQSIGYWHAQWSHTREGTWKGFVSVALDPVADLAAKSILASGDLNAG